MSFTDIHTVRISRYHVDATEDALREAGGEGFERFVFWSGELNGSGVFEVETVHVPRQKAFKTRDGLLVRVDGDELHRLNAWLYEHGQLLAVQVHAHPADAYHSETDDTFPIITAQGGISIVVPAFCRDGLMADGVAVYRLQPEGWAEVDERLLEVR
jgi:hypothetical protein